MELPLSEVAGFMGVIGWYFVEVGDKDMARKYYDILKKVAPDHPMTKQLKLYFPLTDRAA